MSDEPAGVGTSRGGGSIRRRMHVPWWMAWRHGAFASDDGGHMSVARLEAFSDGVIAIGITLLILEVRVPRVHDTGDGAGLLHALGDLWPAYCSYLLSFIQIGIIWANHHLMFRYIRRTNHILLLLNLLLLMCVAFLPFSTALLAEYIQEPLDERRIAALVYGGTLVLTATCFNLVWWYGTSHANLLEPHVDPRLITAITGSYQLGFVAYAVALGVAFFLPVVALMIFAALAFFFAFPGPGKET